MTENKKILFLRKLSNCQFILFSLNSLFLSKVFFAKCNHDLGSTRSLIIIKKKYIFSHIIFGRINKTTRARINSNGQTWSILSYRTGAATDCLYDIANLKFKYFHFMWFQPKTDEATHTANSYFSLPYMCKQSMSISRSKNCDRDHYYLQIWQMFESDVRLQTPWYYYAEWNECEHWVWSMNTE